MSAVKTAARSPPSQAAAQIRQGRPARDRNRSGHIPGWPIPPPVARCRRPAPAVGEPGKGSIFRQAASMKSAWQAFRAEGEVVVGRVIVPIVSGGCGLSHRGQSYRRPTAAGRGIDRSSVHRVRSAALLHACTAPATARESVLASRWNSEDAFVKCEFPRRNFYRTTALCPTCRE